MLEPMQTKPKGKKKWLVALLAASLATIEVLLPAASPLAELLVRAASPLVLQAASPQVEAALDRKKSGS